MTIRVMVERGKRKVVATAFDWPGWERSARSEAEAVRTLEVFRSRYARVAELAGLGPDFAAAGDLEVVEVLDGTSTTDFFGISTVSATAEHGPMTDAVCDRKLALLRAAWSYFDSVPPKVSEVLRKGPRGTGRDRDQIVAHTLFSEADQMSKKVGVRTPTGYWRDPAMVRAHREAYLAALRDYNARGAGPRTWTLQFLVRRSAYHLLDHAWEMEDKDLTPART